MVYGLVLSLKTLSHFSSVYLLYFCASFPYFPPLFSLSAEFLPLLNCAFPVPPAWSHSGYSNGHRKHLAWLQYSLPLVCVPLYNLLPSSVGWIECLAKKERKKVAQLCPTPCDPMDCSLSGSSIYGTFQARVLEGAAISFSMPCS